MDTYVCIAPSVKLGRDVKLSKFINLYGCEIGDETKIGAFVEIQKNASVGKRCKISSHTFICEGVRIEDNVFVGHGVMFINDSYPRATAEGGAYRLKPTGRSKKPLSRRVPRSARVRPSSRTSAWVKTLLSGQGQSSRKTFLRTP